MFHDFNLTEDLRNFKFSGAVLLADDEKLYLKMMADMLSLAGFRVLSASDGEEALRIFQAHKDEIRLCLLDSMMPKLGGAVVFAEIRNRHPELPIIFMSAYDCPENKIVADHIGTLTKPVVFRRLLRMMREMLLREESTLEI